jgi:hypothetical protein
MFVLIVKHLPCMLYYFMSYELLRYIVIEPVDAAIQPHRFSYVHVLVWRLPVGVDRTDIRLHVV